MDPLAAANALLSAAMAKHAHNNNSQQTQHSAAAASATPNPPPNTIAKKPRKPRPSEKARKEERARKKAAEAAVHLTLTPPAAPNANAHAKTASSPPPADTRASRALPPMHSIIVLHPGSTSLRVGLANSAEPLVIPHCIAWRRKSGRPAPFIAPSEADAAHASDALRSVARALRVSSALLALDEPPSPPSLASAAPSPAAATSGAAHSDVDVLVGEEAQRAAAQDPAGWWLFYPFENGKITERASWSVARNALGIIWRAALCGGYGLAGCGVSPSELGGVSAVLVLPDHFVRWDGSALVELLFDDLGVAAALVHEESLCACLGAGVSSACVVDIGAQTTTVCCVDELQPMHGARMPLRYGGDHLDYCLHHLLRSSTPAALCDAILPPAIDASAAVVGADKLLGHACMERLSAVRAACCHLRFPDGGSGGGSGAGVSLPPSHASAPARVELRLGSLAGAVPMLLFAPHAVPQLAGAFTRNGELSAAAAAAASAPRVDWMDAWDASFMEATAPPVRTAAAKGKGKGKKKEGEADGEEGCEDEVDMADVVAPSVLLPPPPVKSVAETERLEKEKFPAMNLEPELTMLGSRMLRGLTPANELPHAPLDEAIVRCVERNRSSEVKRRLFGKILLLGGVARTAGLAQYLEWRIATCWQLAPETGGDGIERVEVATLPCSPDALVWQGAALLPTMSTAREMWVLRREWHGRGVAALREACAFAW